MQGKGEAESIHSELEKLRLKEEKPRHVNEVRADVRQAPFSILKTQNQPGSGPGRPGFTTRHTLSEGDRNVPLLSRAALSVTQSFPQHITAGCTVWTCKMVLEAILSGGMRTVLHTGHVESVLLPVGSSQGQCVCVCVCKVWCGRWPVTEPGPEGRFLALCSW